MYYLCSFADRVVYIYEYKKSQLYTSCNIVYKRKMTFVSALLSNNARYGVQMPSNHHIHRHKVISKHIIIMYSKPCIIIVQCTDKKDLFPNIVPDMRRV